MGREAEDQVRQVQGAAARLQAFGLTANEARVLAALVSAGSATATELARLAGVHRTGVYPVLEDLGSKGVVELVPGRSGVWSTAGPGEVLQRLWAFHEQRLRAVEASLEPTRRLLDELAAGDDGAPGHPSIQFLRGAAKIEGAYEKMLSSARTEVLVFNRPPYGIGYDRPNNVVLELLGRGVATRVVYLASLFDHEGFRIEAAAFVEAGLQARMADDVPIKLAIADRRTVLFGTSVTSVMKLKPFPPNVQVDDAGFAEAMVATFEHYWAAARPLPVASSGEAPRHTIERSRPLDHSRSTPA
ncbi:MAG TPA: helix-turn-helix domain-containing protein [Acidimicrobiales bacterium]|nr:helix-turn-helix domain-containing protein [Acidimicrobiales bacterium]